jgi:sugar lactone lactonase YvrE
MKRLYPSLVIIAAFLLIIACASLASPSTDLPGTLPPEAVKTEQETATPFLPNLVQPDTGTPLPLPSATFTAAVAPIITDPRPIILADHLSQPDDLLLAPDGSIYLSDVGDGTIRRYTQAGGLQLVLSGLNEPEGMVILPDGSMVIAEQGKNRLLKYDPVTQALLPFLDLRNTTGQAGVDGLAWDAASQTIILPDSPNGTILRVSPDGRTVTEIASGFVRPTGAWVEPDGSILVVDEYGNTLNRIHPDGSVEKLAAFSTPDDVIEDGSGNIFVITLGDNAVHFISGTTHQDAILTAQVSGPQGISFDTDGNLVVTDPGNHRLVKLVIH